MSGDPRLMVVFPDLGHVFATEGGDEGGRVSNARRGCRQRLCVGMWRRQSESRVLQAPAPSALEGR